MKAVIEFWFTSTLKREICGITFMVSVCSHTEEVLQIIVALVLGCFLGSCLEKDLLRVDLCNSECRKGALSRLENPTESQFGVCMWYASWNNL